MTKGFVVVTTGGRYLELTEILVRSLEEFSTYPITIFAVNTDVSFSYPNMDPVQLRSLSSPDMHSICYEKFYAAFNNPYDYGVVLDADSIANKGIDLLMTEATEVTLYPFASQHPKDPDNQNALMKLFKVSRKSMPYVHSTSLFSSDAKPFFEDCYWESINLQAIGHSPPNQDETVLNVKLWALEASRYAECYDPYFGFIERYFGDLQAPQHSELYSRERSFVFHGCKSRERASRIFERLREFHRN